MVEMKEPGTLSGLVEEESDVLVMEDHVVERRLTKLRLAGPELSHSRENNLDAVRRLSQSDPYVSFGIRRVIDYVEQNNLEAEDLLQIVAGITKCSKDMHYTQGRGYISPGSTIKGLRTAALTLRRVASQGGTVVFGTGHPGAMLDYYMDLADLVRKLGGRVIDLAKGQLVFQGEDQDHVRVVDSINSIAFLSDTCSALHSHDSKPMELMLNDAERLPDLVVADHGFAGEAINRDIPTIAVMDTNDPGLAVAKNLGANVILIPMNDNRPNVVTREAAVLVRHMAIEAGRGQRAAL
jgi:hypothetical protein